MADSQCIKCWLNEWFDCDDEVGSAATGLAIVGHGRQPMLSDSHVRKLIRALAVRRTHYLKMPESSCSCESEAALIDDPAVKMLDALDKALAAVEVNKHPLPVMFDEACSDMAEFLATHQPEWFIIKDKAELEEAAREAGFVAAERDV